MLPRLPHRLLQVAQPRIDDGAVVAVRIAIANVTAIETGVTEITVRAAAAFSLESAAVQAETRTTAATRQAEAVAPESAARASEQDGVHEVSFPLPTSSIILTYAISPSHKEKIKRAQRP